MIKKESSVKITIPSERIYLDTWKEKDRKAVYQNLWWFNRAKDYVYNLHYDNTFLLKKEDRIEETPAVKQWIRQEFHIEPTDFYITSILDLAKGMVSSQKELIKIYKEQDKAASDRRKEKLKELKNRLQLCQKSKKSLIRHSKNPKNSVYIPDDFSKHCKDISSPECLYQYEVWIDRETKRVRRRMALIEEKERVCSEIDRSVPRRVTFGTRDFYKKKDTTGIPMEEWHEKRDLARNHIMLFVGRYDTKKKNWLCQYDIHTKLMSINMMDRTTTLCFPVHFPYREDDLCSVLDHPMERGCTVAYWLELHKDKAGRDYILIKATFTLKKEVFQDTRGGVFSVDLNLDNISWAELDGKGNRLRGGMVRFSLDGSSGQNKDTIGKACREVMKICASAGKPLVMEKLDLTKKKSQMAYNNPRANRGSSMFAYNKMTAFLEGQAFRAGIGVIQINPAYTSFIGKVKYMRRRRCEIHVAAAYVIGRRAMRFSEKVPAYLKPLLKEKTLRRHHWAHFAALSKNKKVKAVQNFHRMLPAFS